MSSIKREHVLRHELYYYFEWFTERLLSADEIAALEAFISTKVDEVEADILALNIMEDRVQILLSLSPKLSVSEVMQKLKGASSKYMNEHFKDREKFAWNRAYWARTVSKGNLLEAIEYIKGNNDVG